MCVGRGREYGQNEWIYTRRINKQEQRQKEVAVRPHLGNSFGKEESHPQGLHRGHLFLTFSLLTGQGGTTSDSRFPVPGTGPAGECMCPLFCSVHLQTLRKAPLSPGEWACVKDAPAGVGGGGAGECSPTSMAQSERPGDPALRLQDI